MARSMVGGDPRPSAESRSPVGRRWELLLGICGAAIYLLCCNNLPFGHYVDDIKWVLLAESFLRGSVQSAWSAVPLPDTAITWGFGFLLMPVVSLFGRQALAFKMFSALCVLGGSGLFYFSIRRVLDAGGRLLVLAGLGSVAFFAGFSGNVVSESGYLLLFGVFAYGLSRWEEGSPRDLLFMGFVAGALCLVRNIGALVPLSLVLFKRRFPWSRGVVFFVAGLLGLTVPIHMAMNRLSGVWSFYGSYWRLGAGAGPLEWVGRFMGNLVYYWKGLTCMTLINLPAVLPPVPWIKWGFMALGAFVVARGIWILRTEPLGRWLGLYLLGSMVVLGVWTYRAPRYALPVYPVFLVFLGAGVRGAWGLKKGRAVMTGLLLGVLVTNGTEVMGLIRKSFSLDPLVSHESERWLADHSRPEEIVVSMDVARVFYFTGRRGVPFIPSNNAETFEKGARQLGATVFFFKDNDYVPPAPGVSDPIAGQAEALRSILFGSSAFTPVYSNAAERTTIFRFSRPAP